MNCKGQVFCIISELTYILAAFFFVVFFFLSMFFTNFPVHFRSSLTEVVTLTWLVYGLGSACNAIMYSMAMQFNFVKFKCSSCD